MYTFLCLALLALRVSALGPHLRPRADAPSAEDVADLMNTVNDGPTPDGTAGIGAEFESNAFVFTSSDCSADNTFVSKKKVIGGRSGTNWELTADTTDNAAGRLNAEYILDGTQIKVGTGAAAAAATAMVQDLTNWFADGLACGTEVSVQDSVCNPWTVSSINGIRSLIWSTQVTTAMPLEAVYYLWKQQYMNDPTVTKNVLNGFGRSAKTALITKGHFTTNTNGIIAQDVTDDVLGFCTLVMSYAKAAFSSGTADVSPKTYTTFMPRTDFNTMFQQVQAKLPGDLYTLFDSLACFRAFPDVVDENGDLDWDIDDVYCDGPRENPTSKKKFENLQYKNGGQTLKIKDWITGIGAGSPSPDGLTTYDIQFDKSIGGLGDTVEKMYNSQRKVPLFEFRNLNGMAFVGGSIDPPTFMTQVDQGIQALHQQFANPP